MMKRFAMMMLLFMMFCLATMSAFAEEASYPEELVDKIMAMKADAEVKKDMPVSIPGLPTISSTDAQKLWKGKKVVFLDNRVKTQYDTEKIPGAQWFYCDDLLKDPAMAQKLDKNKEYVLYCNGAHCWRSPATGLMLQQLGFKNLHWYRDGLPDWKKKGFPTE